ncbi:hypothetical protein JA1_004437 [Spathaspora sp. JA1]|nr:hypothetical protein JA1_004437 [Spathaspora sp. JA1]
MSSITLSITYNGSTKKFTTSKATAISQLISEALSNFGISKDEYTGTLSYNSKPIDSSLPIRLTPLLNNSKLTLSVTKLDLDFDVNVKLLVDGTSSIKKCGAGLTIRELLESFSVDLTKECEVRILDLQLTSSSGKFDSVKLGSVVNKKLGSVVIRLNYQKSTSEKERIHNEQQEAVKLQLEGERRRKLEDAERRRQEEEEKEKSENILKEQEKAQEQEELDEQIGNTKKEQFQESRSVDQKQEYKPADSVSTPSKDSTPNNPVYIEEPLAETPQLYIPSQTARPTTYENPDEDYEMTLGQAKAYHSIIKASAIKKKKTSPTPASLPSKYLIRVKFPDSSILQINFLEDVHLVKFGQLVKRIEDLLYPNFIDAYNLKVGYPPFTVLGQSFDLNNKLLHEMPDFRSERITLIWELIKNDLNISGPYVKSGGEVTVRATTEMPEQILESVRGKLPDDEREKKLVKEVDQADDRSGSKSKKSTKLPKWLKFK